ncbi:hypothetical protein EDD85DRAFT_943759 [Armillaria nabsnona]|nr:hypothetical protein EDD85DRAFT_943759 [Armillaria nabsnona]
MTEVTLILSAVFLGIGCALLGAALVIAIRFHCQKPQTYINQYNANPIVNYVLPQQPPEARTYAPVRNHGLTEIHELPCFHSQRAMKDEPPSLSSPPPPALPSMSFEPPLPYPLQTLPSDFADSRCVRDNDTAAAPAAFDPDTLWDTITPSAFLSVSTFIPPRKSTPENRIEDPEYLSILNWDQLVPGSQYEWIPFDDTGAPEPYSQEPTPEPVTRPFQPPWW